jgi:hypothetical protein
MRTFGAFLSNLRSSAGLSLEVLALLVGSFAVDDCIILTNSKIFESWTRDEIKTTVIS